MTRMTLEWVTTDISEQWRMQDLGGGFSTRDPHTFSKGVWGSAVSSPIGVWGGAPATLQLSQFLSHKT